MVRTKWLGRRSGVRFRAAALAVLLGASAAGGTADGATMVYVDVEQLTEWSDVVVFGRVSRDAVYVGTEGRITTRWSVDVETTLVGTHHETVRFIQWAGELDGHVEHVSGDATLDEGGRYVLFLRGDDPQDLTLTALSLSVYTVEAGPPPPQPADPILHGTLGRYEPSSPGVAAVQGRVEPGELQVDIVVPSGLRVVRDLEGVGFVTDEGIVEGRTERLSLIHLVERVRAAAEAR
jgi:hypothetical protein